MNKQAIAFLSMFTLVFMLAIYYVSLEEDTVQVIAPVQGVEDVMEVMRQTIENEKANEILALKAQLSESDIDKNQLLSEIEKIEINQKREDDIESKLVEIGYKSVINIKNDVVTIHVFESEDTPEEATLIMTSIYPLIKSDELIEVSFS